MLRSRISTPSACATWNAFREPCPDGSVAALPSHVPPSMVKSPCPLYPSGYSTSAYQLRTQANGSGPWMSVAPYADRVTPDRITIRELVRYEPPLGTSTVPPPA